MPDTNVGSAWNGGDLEFRQSTGPSYNATGPLLFCLNAATNGVYAQLNVAATAGVNVATANANYRIAIKDNTGTTYYLIAAPVAT